MASFTSGLQPSKLSYLWIEKCCWLNSVEWVVCTLNSFIIGAFASSRAKWIYVEICWIVQERSINQVDWLMGWSIIQSINQSINQSIYQSIFQSSVILLMNIETKLNKFSFSRILLRRQRWVMLLGNQWKIIWLVESDIRGRPVVFYPWEANSCASEGVSGADQMRPLCALLGDQAFWTPDRRPLGSSSTHWEVGRPSRISGMRPDAKVIIKTHLSSAAVVTTKH